MSSKIGFWLRQLGNRFLVLARLADSAMVSCSRCKNLRRFFAKFPTFERICVYSENVEPPTVLSKQ
jgi:hypothetical protein